MKFKRDDSVKYISHLDILAVFERAFRRINAPILYTKGFNPRPKLVFGLPLAVGVTSTAEYVDIEFETDINGDTFFLDMNSNLPQGIEILQIENYSGKDNIMAQISVANYESELESDKIYTDEDLQMIIQKFLKQDEIFIEKKGKKGIKKINIRQYIRAINLINSKGSKLECQGYNNYLLTFTVSAGNKLNLRPEILLKVINELFENKLLVKMIHRTGMFIEIDDKVLSPLDSIILIS